MVDWTENYNQPCGYLREVKYSDEYTGLCAKTKRRCDKPHRDHTQVRDCISERTLVPTIEDVVECLWKIVPKRNQDRHIRELCDGCSGYDKSCEDYIEYKDDKRSKS